MNVSVIVNELVGKPKLVRSTTVVSRSQMVTEMLEETAKCRFCNIRQLTNTMFGSFTKDNTCFFTCATCTIMHETELNENLAEVLSKNKEEEVN